MVAKWLRFVSIVLLGAGSGATSIVGIGGCVAGGSHMDWNYVAKPGVAKITTVPFRLAVCSGWNARPLERRENQSLKTQYVSHELPTLMVKGLFEYAAKSGVATEVDLNPPVWSDYDAILLVHIFAGENGVPAAYVQLFAPHSVQIAPITYGLAGVGFDQMNYGQYPTIRSHIETLGRKVVEEIAQGVKGADPDGLAYRRERDYFRALDPDLDDLRARMEAAGEGGNKVDLESQAANYSDRLEQLKILRLAEQQVCREYSKAVVNAWDSNISVIDNARKATAQHESAARAAQTEAQTTVALAMASAVMMGFNSGLTGQQIDPTSLHNVSMLAAQAIQNSNEVSRQLAELGTRLSFEQRQILKSVETLPAVRQAMTKYPEYTGILAHNVSSYRREFLARYRKRNQVPEPQEILGSRAATAAEEPESLVNNAYALPQAVSNCLFPLSRGYYFAVVRADQPQAMLIVGPHTTQNEAEGARQRLLDNSLLDPVFGIRPHLLASAPWSNEGSGTTSHRPLGWQLVGSTESALAFFASACHDVVKWPFEPSLLNPNYTPPQPYGLAAKLVSGSINDRDRLPLEQTLRAQIDRDPATLSRRHNPREEGPTADGQLGYWSSTVQGRGHLLGGVVDFFLWPTPIDETFAHAIEFTIRDMEASAGRVMHSVEGLAQAAGAFSDPPTEVQRDKFENYLVWYGDSKLRDATTGLPTYAMLPQIAVMVWDWDGSEVEESFKRCSPGPSHGCWHTAQRYAGKYPVTEALCYTNKRGPEGMHTEAYSVVQVGKRLLEIKAIYKGQFNALALDAVRFVSDSIIFHDDAGRPIRLARSDKMVVPTPVAQLRNELVALPPRILAEDAKSVSALEEDVITMPRPIPSTSSSDGKTLSLALGGGITMELILIPSGSFIMGSPAGEEGREPNEGPQHSVEITKALYIGKYEVTNAQYRRFKRSHNSGKMGKHDLDGDNQPATHISWQEASEFCEWLSKTVGRPIRLPTEAEWEYATRAGTTTRYWWGNEEDRSGKVANVGDRRHKSRLAELDLDFPTFDMDDGYLVTAPVGRFSANGFGLHDTIGNVEEWCNDWCGEEYYSSSPARDPRGPQSGEARVLRGCSSAGEPDGCRSAARSCALADDSDYGFRIVAEVE